MGVMMENSYTAALILLRNVVNPLVISADKSFLSLSHKSKLLHLFRQLVVGVFLLLLHLLRLFPTFLLPFSIPFNQDHNHIHDHDDHNVHNKSLMIINTSTSTNTNTKHGSSAIARALSQLLLLINDVPVSSRKYEVVRNLAEKIIHDNLEEKSEILREVNCVVISDAFAKTLAQLEAALLDQDYDQYYGSTDNINGLGLEFKKSGLIRAMRVVHGWYRKARMNGGPHGLSAEKMAAELLWLAQKLEESGGVEVAVGKWAWASNLGLLGLAADPRVQASLVKLTAFLIKQAKDMGKEQDNEGGKTEQQKQTKIKMLMTWLPLLCRATNGTDAPTLSSNERGEIERALEEMIDTLEEEENQEKILSLWLHHFTQCPLSDWPNLNGSYIRWCTVSRKLLLSR